MSDHDLDEEVEVAREAEFQDRTFTPPAGPPGEVAPALSVPDHFAEVEKFLRQIVADESLVMSYAYSQAFFIVEREVARHRVGIDNFTGDQALAPVLMNAQLATPLAVEIYKQALASINQPQNAQRLAELVRDAKAKVGDGILIARA